MARRRHWSTTFRRRFRFSSASAAGAGWITFPSRSEFLKHPASTRDPLAGDPLITFRYDQDAEFIDAIRNNRPCWPSFLDGARAQAVMDAVLTSEASQKWVDVEKI